MYTDESNEIKALVLKYQQIEKTLNITSDMDCMFNVDDMLIKKGFGAASEFTGEQLDNLFQIAEEDEELMNDRQTEWKDVARDAAGFAIPAMAVGGVMTLGPKLIRSVMPKVISSSKAGKVLSNVGGKFKKNAFPLIGAALVTDYLTKSKCGPEEFCETKAKGLVRSFGKLIEGDEACVLKDSITPFSFSLEPEEYDIYRNEKKCSIRCFTEWTDWEMFRLLKKYEPDINEYNKIMNTNINIDDYINIIRYSCYDATLNEKNKISDANKCIDDNGFFTLSDDNIIKLKELNNNKETSIYKMNICKYITEKNKKERPSNIPDFNCRLDSDVLTTENKIYYKELIDFLSEYEKLYDILINKKRNDQSRIFGKSPINYCNKSNTEEETLEEIKKIEQGCMYRHKSNCNLNWNHASKDIRIPYHYWNPEHNACVIQPNIWEQRTMCDCATKKGNGLLGSLIEGEANAGYATLGALACGGVTAAITKNPKYSTMMAAQCGALASGQHMLGNVIGDAVKNSICNDQSEYDKLYTCEDVFNDQEIDINTLMSNPGSKIENIDRYKLPNTGMNNKEKQEFIKKITDNLKDYIVMQELELDNELNKYLNDENDINTLEKYKKLKNDDNLNIHVDKLINNIINSKIIEIKKEKKNIKDFVSENYYAIEDLKNLSILVENNENINLDEYENLINKISLKTKDINIIKEMKKINYFKNVKDENIINKNMHGSAQKTRGGILKFLNCNCGIDIDYQEAIQTNPDNWKEISEDKRKKVCEGKLGMKNVSNLPDRAIEWSNEYGNHPNMCYSTKSFCKETEGCWYYNDKIYPKPDGEGMMDCNIPTGQKVAEGLFGTTITRTFKKIFSTLFDVELCPPLEKNILMGSNVYYND